MNHFFNIFNTSSRASRASARRKSLRRGSTSTELEYLEPRLLLTIDSLASIEGIVYDDLTNDGLTGDDVRQQSVQVELFRDGGDGVFNNGGGDDVSQGTRSTNSSGVYRFDDLTAGRYFASQDAISGLIQRPGENVVTIDVSVADAGGIAGLLIDAFDDPDPDPGPPIVPTHEVSVSSAGSLIDSSARLANGVVGSERDLSLELTSATGGLSLNANAFNQELLEFNSSTTAVGIATIVWDGVDGDALTVDPTGLGGVDLTDAGLSTGFKLVAGVDQDGVTITVRVHTDANSVSDSTMNVANTGGPASDALLVLFSSFTQSSGATGPADFTDVGAIELIITGVTAADGQFGLASSQGPLVKAANFANVQPVSLGNLVWNDINNNGQFDSGTETGIPDVTVQLYSDTDGSGTFTAANDVFVTSIVTGGSGDYLFSNLLPGEYVVRIPQAEFDPGGDLETFSASSTGNDPAPDPDTNVNNDDNGTLLSGQGAVTQAVTLLGNTEPDNDGDLDTNTNLSVDFGFFQPIDLQISKVDSADPVNAGGAFTYTLTVRNNGPETATGVVATDSLPAGVSFVGGSATQGTVSESSGTVTASLGTLASGASATITINVTANDDTVGTITNNASVTGDQFDIVAGNNSTSEPTTVTPVIDLAVTKTDSVDPVNAGGTLVYTVTVRNNGPSTATSVVLTDTLPAGVSFSSLTTSAGSASESSGVITGTLGTLASGASATVTITVDINNSTVGTITNNASVTATETELNSNDNSTSEPTTVNPLVDVRVTKSDSADPVDAGSQFSYTVVVSNTGPSTASGVTLTDLLPAGVSFSSGTTTQGTISESSGTVTASLGALAAGASETVTIIVDVAGTTSGTITNNASVTSVEADSNSANNSTTEDTTIVPVVDLVVAKSDNPDAVNAGGLLTYTVLVTNNGPSPATSVTLTDILPTAVAFDSGSATQGTVTESSGTVTASLGTLASGASATVTILTTVANSASGTITNSASVVATETETNTANNSDTEPTTVTPVIDLSITKTDDVDPVDAGGTLVYSLVVTNAGPSTATGVIVTDVIPGDVTFVSSTTTLGSVGEASGVVTANVGTLARGASATVTITVTAAGTAVGTFTNNASVTGNQTDINTANNFVSEDTTINPVVDLVVTKTDSVDPVNAGASFSYTVTVRNDGPSTATGVVLTDTLPAGISVDSTSSSQGSVGQAGGVVTANVGTLASGASATVTINVTVADSTVGTIVNNATVTANETETDSSNNSTMEPTVVTPVVDLSVTKADDVDPIFVNGSVTYTLVVVNAGPSTATGVTLVDTLPAGLSFGGGSTTQGSVSSSGNLITANVGTLASGASSTVTLIATAGTTLGTVTNSATVSATQTETNAADNTAIETTTINPQVDVRISKSDSADPVNAGGSFAYTVTVTNDGPSTANGVVVTDVLPAGVTFDTGSVSQGTVSESSGTVTANVGALASGASATITLNVDVADSTRGTLTNAVSVTSAEPDTNSGNNSDTETTVITPVVDLAITKSDSADPVNAGGSFAYTLTVTNNGPSTANGVTLTDLLPSEVSFDSGSASQGSVTESSGTVTASIGTLASGASATVTLNVTAADSARGTITNSASVTGN